MWEYLIISLSSGGGSYEARLNDLGKQGWELVAVSDGLAYLKRPTREL